MSYQETAHRYAVASFRTYGEHPTSMQRIEACERLPLSEWADALRVIMTPQTIAANHALHVSDCALDLRRALWEADETDDPMARLAALANVEDAARALLAAIGEGEQ
jgi:hypothetical protein